MVNEADLIFTLVDICDRQKSNQLSFINHQKFPPTPSFPERSSRLTGLEICRRKQTS